MRARRPLTAGMLSVLALSALALAGCSSGSPIAASSTGAGTGSFSAPAIPTLPPSGAGSTGVAPSVSPSPSATTSAAATSTAPASSSPSTAAAPQPRSTCSKVTVRVINGSGVTGREFAALQFVNAGSSPCVLNGYPQVSLLRDGAVVGHMSAPASSATSSRSLAPGDVAESQLYDYVMNCNAPLSDTVRVRVPGSDQVSDRPGELRACTLVVTRLGAPE